MDPTMYLPVLPTHDTNQNQGFPAVNEQDRRPEGLIEIPIPVNTPAMVVPHFGVPREGMNIYPLSRPTLIILLASLRLIMPFTQRVQSSIEGLNSFQTAAVFLFSVSALTFVFSVVKNRYLSPLRHFPGPFLASISPLYFVWAFQKGDEHITIEKLHKKYGPIVRVQPDFLVFADPKMIPVVYSRHADKTNYNRMETGEKAGLLAIIDHKEHAAARKRIANPYSMSAARAQEPMIDNRIIEWIEKIKDSFARTGDKMDFAQWTQYFAYDVISEITFGNPFGFVKTSSDVHGLIQAFHDGAFGLSFMARWEILKTILQQPIVQKYLMPDIDNKIGIGRLCSERDKLLKERLDSGQKSQGKVDLMQHFLNAKNADGSPMPLADVKAELLLVLFAGSDTTAATLREILINLTQNPECYKRFIAEIDDFVESKGKDFSVISFDEAQSLKYFTACIKESMRISPSAPIMMPRAPPKGGLTLEDGRYIPENTKMSANSHVTQRNKELYGEDADQFNPERWLGDEVKNRLMEKYDIHFGAGARTCLGKHIAYLELWKGTFEFFRNFKPTLFEPEKITTKNIGILVHKNMWVTVETRD